MTKAEFNLETVGNQINRGISFIIYSDPGVGKTTMAATLPSDSTLIINSEAGLGPLLGTGHHVFNVLRETGSGKSVEQVIDDVYSKLRTQSHPFKNVVVDNLSELEQQLILSLTQRRGKDAPELREYGESSYKMREWCHNFRDLVYNNINVIFNAWEFPIEIKNSDGQVVSRTFPMIGKKVAPQVCGIVDVVGHLEVNSKSNKRWVRFGPHDQYVTKCQFQGLEMGEHPDFPTIIKKLMDHDYTRGESDGDS
jgi:phage nucleotide-binding protein